MGGGAMEMDAGVALTAVGTGGGGAGGLGALCLVDLVGAGGWGSAASGSLELTELSCNIQGNVQKQTWHNFTGLILYLFLKLVYT